jgi:exodeoxyribonuclease-3
MGDLNVAPLPIDVYDPVRLQGHVCFRPEVRAALERMVQWGLVDLFRLHSKEPGQYTYWDYRPGNPFKHNRGWRLDHLLATPPLAQRCIACYIDKGPRAAEHPSDHTPIVAEFDL